MQKEVRDLIRVVMKYDIMLAFITSIIIAILYNLNYSFVFILGLIVGLLNFIVNSLVLDYMLGKKAKSPILNLISLFLRSSIICLIGITLFTYNKYYLIVYIIGVVSHFIAIILYAIKIKK
ncbi:ATP synthase subunit I [Clostridium hydrogeniformans]|uniref:ATP synthase subunit I n=1 Tax=Clostridium hydrogeniformans TaxID=349933 RepID=UPI000489F836